MSFNKDEGLSSINLPPTFPGLSLIPSHISACYLNGRKQELESQINAETQMKIMELEKDRDKHFSVSNGPSITTTDTSILSGMNKNMDTKSTSDIALQSLQNQRQANTKLDNPLSFGMARLLGEVQKKCEAGKCLLKTALNSFG